MKKKEKEQAISLRKRGWSLGMIANELSVAKSTVSLWVRDVIVPEEFALNLKKSGSDIKIAHETKNRQLREKRVKCQSNGRYHIKNSDKASIKKGFFYALFIAEGDKARNYVAFSNTDPMLVRYFFDCVNEFFSVEEREWKVRINCYTNNGLTLEDIETYWLGVLGLSKENLNKATVKQNYHTSSRKVKHPYGVCRIKLHRTDIVQNLYGSVKEILGDQSEKWLD